MIIQLGLPPQATTPQPPIVARHRHVPQKHNPKRAPAPSVVRFVRGSRRLGERCAGGESEIRLLSAALGNNLFNFQPAVKGVGSKSILLCILCKAYKFRRGILAGHTDTMVRSKATSTEAWGNKPKKRPMTQMWEQGEVEATMRRERRVLGTNCGMASSNIPRSQVHD